ncbi:MAG: hypothetical protein LUE90_00085 [Clostridiales bacterium]|nr:hypothetical protein [Clostridiales bacterium]
MLSETDYYAIVDELKDGSLLPVKTELDEQIFHSMYVYNKNKWISPQMELALKLIDSQIPKESF